MIAEHDFVPSIVSEAGDTMVNETDVTPDLLEFICHREGQAKTKQIDSLRINIGAEMGERWRSNVFRVFWQER